ncbi:MAG: hypothetical protein SF066_06955 [Thermoanaerobaculia bacterium]|nr:hypothetical protein [Thermoanaerobaculia bacterium]
MLVELVLWSAEHETTGAPEATLRAMRDHREDFLAEVRRLWEAGPTVRPEPR